MNANRKPLARSPWFLASAVLAALAATIVFGPLMLLGALISANGLFSEGRLDVGAVGLGAMCIGGLAGLVGFWVQLFIPWRLFATHARLRWLIFAMLVAGIVSAMGGAVYFAGTDGAWFIGSLVMLASAGVVVARGVWRAGAGGGASRNVA